MKLSRIRAALAAITLGALAPLAAGCFQKPAAGGGAHVLRYALTNEPTTLDPALVEDGTTIDLLQQVFEGLVRWDDQNHIVPGIAERWDVSADGKTYTFHLRSGVKFHNGRLLTAADFKYSIERACGPTSPTAATYLKDVVGAVDCIQGHTKRVSGVTAPDDRTLTITIDAYKPYWLGNLTYPTAWAVCREVVEKNGGLVNENSAVGTGPFRLSEFRRGYRVALAANKEYWGGAPKLDGIERPIIKEAVTRLSKYQAGELDITDVSPKDLDNINGNPALRSQLHTWPRAAIWYIAVNSLSPDGRAFARPEARRAIAAAIDKKEVVRVALRDQATIANGILPPQIPGYNPNVKPIAYDPAGARAMLASAGFPDAKGIGPITLSFRQDLPHAHDVSEVVADQLRKNLGLDVRLRPMEYATMLKERTNGTMPLYHIRWAADYLDPQDFLSVMLHTNRKVNGQYDHPENGVGYSSAQFDALCDQADSEHDPAKRMKMYRQAEQIAVDDAPWVPIYFQKDLELVKPGVTAIRDSVFGHLPYTTTSVSR